MPEFPTRPPAGADSPRATYLGFDYGDKQTGVAVGQRVTGLANGLETLRSRPGDVLWRGIARLVEIWRPAAFVVGIPHPIQVTTEPNPFVGRVLRFCRELRRRHPLPLYVMDEALSTRESQSLFQPQRGRKALRFAEIKDTLAAQLILQTWLDHTRARESADA